MTDRQLGNTGQTSQTPENARHGAVPPPLPKQDTKPTTKSKIPLTASILTGILVLAAMTAAYFLLGDNGKAAKDAYAEKERQLAEQARIEKERQKALQDSLERNFVSPDLALFELHGPVKSMKSTTHGYTGDLLGRLFSGTTIEFDRKGLWTNREVQLPDMESASYRLRQQGGYITGIDIYPSYSTTEADDRLLLSWDSGRVIMIEEEGYEWYGRERYRYDGEHMTSFDFNGGAEDCTTESQASVSYDSFDDYGNWTSRTFTVSSTRRCGGDEYNALTGQTIPSHSEKSETTTRQIRRITYWDKEY